MSAVLVLHGPNLNLLGMREPDHYGKSSLQDINHHLEQMGKQAGLNIDCLQSNAEHELIERIHSATTQDVKYIIINPACFTHTSVALRDALAAVKIPFIEVHLSNIHAREEFRQHSFFSDLAEGVISGLGPLVYELALHAVIATLNDTNKK